MVAHVRSPQRRAAVAELAERGADMVVGDLADLAQTVELAGQVNALGRMDAVIHNAGVYTGMAMLPVNVVAPYVLTALITRPQRLVYLGSSMHRGGRARLDGLDWTGTRRACSYSDSKLLFMTMVAAVARLWPDTLVSTVHPGWVPTRMGGAGAPDDLTLGHVTQVWLATSDDERARTSGGYWFHQRLQETHPAVHDVALQEELLQTLTAFTGVTLPRGTASSE